MMNRFLELVVEGWKKIPRCWSYVYVDPHNRECIICYFWLFGRKWEMFKVRDENHYVVSKAMGRSLR